MAGRGVPAGRGTGGGQASAPAVDWGAPDDEELEVLEMVPEGPGGARPRPAPRGTGGRRKAAALAVVAVLVAASLGALLLMRPEPEEEKPRPPGPPVDILSDADVYISEVRPFDLLHTVAPFVELRVGPSVQSLANWRLTTFDNDSYLFPADPVSGDPSYIVVDFPSGRIAPGDLSLDPADELALFTPDGKLADFVRWAGGGTDRDPARGGWAAGETGPYLDSGQSVSRLDFARCNHTAWNASPPSRGEPNIWEFAPSNARQVFWLRSGRNFGATLGTGPGALSLPAGRPVPRSLLQETAAHLDFALKQIRRLGDPYSALNSSTGAPVLELWVTNRSAYTGIGEPGGRVSLDLGPNRNINSFVCAREIAGLVLRARWGPPDDRYLFIREGLAISEGLLAAAREISPSQPSVKSLWQEMNRTGLPSPFRNGRNLTQPFIQPWSYDPDHLIGAWLFYDSTDRRFVESGLGASLAQAVLFSQKDPLTALQEQTGRNLTTLFYNWLEYRTGPLFDYAPALLQTAVGLETAALDGRATLQGWAGWVGRVSITVTGDVEFNLSASPGSAGPVYFKLTNSRTGAVLTNGPVPPGQAVSLLAADLRPGEELQLLAGAGAAGGELAYRAARLPEGPANLSPPDGSFSLDPRPLLGWSSVPDATGYQVQVALDTIFSSPELDERTSGLSLNPQNPLPDGAHYWRVRGWTSLGNPTSWSAPAQLFVDTVAPFAYPEIDEPKYRASPSDAWNVSSMTQLSFRLDAGEGSPETVHYKFAGDAGYTLYSGTFQATGADGPRTLLYYSQDAAGNRQGEQALELFLDDTPPEIDVSLGKPNFAASPGDIVNVSRDTPITIIATDPGSGPSTVTYRVSSQTQTYEGPFKLPGPDGIAVIFITALDRLGTQNSLLYRLNVDSSPPAFAVQGLSNGTLGRGAHSVTVTASDWSGVSRVRYVVDGQTLAAPTAAPYAWDWDTAGIADGDHTVQVVVEDNLGNFGTVSYAVVTDNTPPVTSLALGTPKYRLQGSDLWNVSAGTMFNLTSSDATSGVAATWILIDGAYREGLSFQLDKSIGDGQHEITYGCRDRSGNNETGQTITVVLDATPPAPIINTPAQASQVAGLVYVEASDQAGSGDVKGCLFSYSVDGATWIDIWEDWNGTTKWSCNWNTVPLPDGNYFLRALMYDYLENGAPALVQVLKQN
ncbi:MAG: hypothetical protein FJ149_07010 [Euryarchaeota archaeon]|nr:hypothetical protein [Euryarchaeota archaeon]